MFENTEEVDITEERRRAPREEGAEDKAVADSDHFNNDTGHPSADLLRELVDAGTPEAYEALREMADNFNVEYTDDTTPQEFYDKISLNMELEADNERLS